MARDLSRLLEGYQFSRGELGELLRGLFPGDYNEERLGNTSGGAVSGAGPDLGSAVEEERKPRPRLRRRVRPRRRRSRRRRGSAAGNGTTAMLALAAALLVAATVILMVALR